ncbi:MAG: hypothetical protein MUE61_02360 [Vicinamibacterales bacterium]|jgi:hypothetical protein|nr:hypothetical protein [Vicinamibacterales bacterium]
MNIHPSMVRAAVAWCAIAVLAMPASAQMPDARQMSGIPMPASDVPAGSVSVRLVRGELTNNIAAHRVELHAGSRIESATTDQDGRAVFSGLQPGTSVHAAAEVDGQVVESQPFTVPPDAGVRLVLVAGASGAPSAEGPVPAAGPGEVVFAGDSRIQIEFDDDTLEVFYLFDLVNPSSAPVTPKAELVFDLPEGAEQGSLLEGSSTQATIRGRSVSITGPIPPGSLPVRLAFSLPPAGPERTIVQKLPAPWARVQVIMTKAGAARMTSPQFIRANEMAGDGQAFILGAGGALPANQAIAVTLSGLPSRSRWGRNLSLGIAALILLAGAWAAMSARASSGDASRLAALVERRDRLMADLVRTEEQRRAGTLDEHRHAARHADLVAQLERVYGELDRQPGAAAEV